MAHLKLTDPCPICGAEAGEDCRYGHAEPARRPSVRVNIVQPIAGSLERAALDMNFEVTPGRWTGATVTPTTARAIIRELRASLAEIGEDFPSE